MKYFFTALLIVCGMAPVANADLNDNMGNADISYGRPVPRPPGRGRPHPHPGPGYPNPPPPPRPNPGYPPPPPPPAYRYEYVLCSSQYYRYTECFFNPYGVAEVRLFRQHSYEPCYMGQTAGVYQDRLWVDRGCSATFEVIRYY